MLSTGLTGSKAGKARQKIRRLTRALGSVRELDVTVQLLDELARSPHVSRDAVEDVRARVMKERDAKRKVMIERLKGVNIENSNGACPALALRSTKRRRSRGERRWRPACWFAPAD